MAANKEEPGEWLGEEKGGIWFRYPTTGSMFVPFMQQTGNWLASLRSPPLSCGEF